MLYGWKVLGLGPTSGIACRSKINIDHQRDKKMRIALSSKSTKDRHLTNPQLKSASKEYKVGQRRQESCVSKDVWTLNHAASRVYAIDLEVALAI